MWVNCNWASPPNPLSLRRGGLKLPFLPSFLLEIFPENEQEKVTCPPSPQGEGARG
mgnify:CR=1 FL=1